MTPAIEYKSVRYQNMSQGRSLEDIEHHIMTTKNKVVTTEAVRDVLRARIRRVKELEREIHQLREQALIRRARGPKGGVAK